MNYDFFIVGQGLAGSLLAWRLSAAKQRVLVIDDNRHTAASKVAAGMINPLAGMRFNAHPDTDHWLAAALDLYRALGQAFNKTYWHPIRMQRLFRSEQQKRFYQRQHVRPNFQHYLGTGLQPRDQYQSIQYPYGGFWQEHTGYVDLPTLLIDIQNWLQQQQALLTRSIDYSHIQVLPEQVMYQQEAARHLIFCEGYRIQSNPWFNYLPIQADKGEILTLHSDQIISPHIINAAHWLIPLVDGNYRFGATHAHNTFNTQTTRQGWQSLQQGLRKLLKLPHQPTIINHLAGVRPGTQDRQPLIGTHPQSRRLHVFNGFGARGALSIPWFAHCLADYLLHGRKLPVEAAIQRYPCYINH